MIQKILTNLAVKVVGKILPKKAKSTISGLVNDVVINDKDIQKEIAQHQAFILQYEGRAEFLPKVVAIVRSLVRPIVTFAFTFVFLRDYWVHRELPPDKLIYMTGGILAFWFGSRLLEKKKGLF